MVVSAKKLYDQLIANDAMPPNEDLHWCFAMNGEDFVRVEIGNEGTSRTGFQFDGRTEVAVGGMIARDLNERMGIDAACEKAIVRSSRFPSDKTVAAAKAEAERCLANNKPRLYPTVSPAPAPAPDIE